MSGAQARAWWAEVEHLKEPLERRRRGDSAPAVSPSHAPARRTVTIRGRVLPGAPTQPLREISDDELAGTVVAGPWAQPRPLRHRRAAPRRRSRTGARPDRLAAWAIGVALGLALLAAATAHAATHLGQRPLKMGMHGRDVRQLQLRLRHSGLLHAPATAMFGPLTEQALLSYQRSRCLGADGVAGAETVHALNRGKPPCGGGGPAVGGMRPATASQFGPGLYGSRTACGQRLTARLRGVAHRTLPCGTRITFVHAGHTITVPVVDRGPYVRGVTFDLTTAAARSLGLAGTGRLLASAL